MSAKRPSPDLVNWCEDYLQIRGTVRQSYSPNTAKSTALEVMQLRDPWSDPDDRLTFFSTIARLAAQAFIDGSEALKQTRRAAKRAFGGSTARPSLPLADLRQMLDSALRGPARESTTAIVLYIGFCALTEIEPEPELAPVIVALDEPRQLAVRQARDWGLTLRGDQAAYQRLLADVMNSDEAAWGPYRRASAFLGLLALGWWRPDRRPTRAAIESIAESEATLLTAMLRSLDAWRKES